MAKVYSKIIQMLKNDEVKNINIINFMENNTVRSIETAGDSVLLKGRSDREWIYISSSSEAELKILKSKLDGQDKNFGAIEEWMIPILTEDKNVIWDLSMAQYYLPEDIELPESEIKTVPLTSHDAKIVYENSEYKDFISIDYVIEQIERGISAGFFENGWLAAWGMTQDDGGMGFLHVLAEHRRKGYGRSITLALIEQIRKKGKLPFAYIEEDNVKSINLILKLGFKKDKKIHWFGIKRTLLKFLYRFKGN